MPFIDDPASRIVTAWRGHNTRLLVDAVGSVGAAIALWIAAASPDGRDPFYVALAIEFAAWGVINGVFASMGRAEVGRLSVVDPAVRESAIIAKGASLRRLLRLNHWLNALWLSIGVALLVWGYAVWSPAIVGHGVGVLSQAIVLTTMDLAFQRALSATPAD